MANRKRRKLPQTNTLCQILPKGAESGNEFARIVDLLLFHEARRKGRRLALFDDSPGDFHGLDAFEGDASSATADAAKNIAATS